MYGANVIIFEGILAFYNSEVVKVSLLFFIFIKFSCQLIPRFINVNKSNEIQRTI